MQEHFQDARDLDAAAHAQQLTAADAKLNRVTTLANNLQQQKLTEQLAAQNASTTLAAP